ncbi:MAG TPA: alkaline phosphatase family protein [Albitalea sp.]|nr:alkaline phosphatase family protein [Albitalea sp.]
MFFAGRTHEAFIELAEDEERFFRLPPMSAGPVFIDAFDAYTTRGPHDSIVFHSGPTSELQLELKHSQHLSLTGTNRIVANSLWHDDLWRLRVRRQRGSPDPAVTFPPRQYRIRALYSSVLPVLERRVAARFFHEGFEANWNRQQYLKIRFIGHRMQILVEKNLAALYGLKPEAADIGSGFVTFKSIDTGRLSFVDTVDMSSLRLDVGAGPHPIQGGNAMYFSVRGEFPAIKCKVDLPGPDKDIDLTPFHIDLRFYLTSLGKLLQYMPTIESNLLDRLDFSVPTVGNIKQLVKKGIEDALYHMQAAPDSGSKFGDFVGPWLVGGTQELFSLGYAPGAGDQLRGDGSVEPATGELIVNYIGPRPPPDTTMVLTDDTGGSTAPVNDGAVRLFNVPDEEPDPLPGTPGSGGTSPFGGGPTGPRPDMGALAKVDHIVVLMLENRSFDQVLGYLRRDRGRLDVDGLLPPGTPGSETQRNRFANREFVPTHATQAEPARSVATAWPSFSLPGPGHDTEDVRSQMADGMGGFVASFARRLKLPDATDPTAVNLRLVMDYFDDTDLPVYGVLAKEFAICDHWYTSHAGPTWPNRFVLNSGDLNRDRSGTIEVDNPDYLKMIPLQRASLFDLLNERGVPWRVYEHGYSFLRLFRNFTFDVTNIVPFDDPVRGFEGAARSGALPPVTFIEPDYIDLPPGNDDHPPADMVGGQQLVNRIVRALVASPAFERTLLIVTYDEHGGFYDHVQPPNDAPPLSGSFTKLGPRVPAFLVSPLVGRASVVHDRFDHTSIGATILRRFCGRNVPKVSPRLDAAKDLRSALTRADSPRPRSEFDHLALPPLAAPAPRSGVRKRVGPPETKDDFHGLLAAVRLTTGQPPVATGAVRRGTRSTSGELLFYRDTLRNGSGTVANPSVIGAGGWQAFRLLFGGGNGMIYAVDAAGRLLLYRDRMQDGTGDVANPQVLATGWQTHLRGFSGGNGIVYAVDAQGRLLFHRHSLRETVGVLSAPAVIGRGGWQGFKFVVGGGDGAIYAVNAQGQLLFYRDKTLNGSGDVASPTVIGLGGWQGLTQLMSGGDGILYAVDGQGRLLFYRDKSRTGTGDVASPTVIGSGGWQAFKFLVSGGNGVLYAVRP